MATPPTADPSAPPPPPPFGLPAPRQLRRRPDQGPIAGVCAGVAEYFRLDPVIVRIAAVVLAVSGPGVIAYVLAWIFVPAASGAALQSSTPSSDRTDRGAQIFGIVLLVIALCVLWGDWWSPARRWLFPLALLALGSWLLLRREGSDDDGGSVEPPPVPPATDPVPWSATPAAAPTVEVPADVDPTVVDGTADQSSTVAEGSDDTAGNDSEPPTTPWSYGPPPDVPDRNGAARRRRRMLGPVVMGALLVWSGIAWMAGLSVENGLAVGLCIIGVGFVLGAFVGGSWALIFPAFALGGALIVASVADIPLNGPIGDRTWVPQEVSALQTRYELSVGEGTLDLTDLPLGADDHVTITASVGIGHLVILVPDGAALDVSAEVAAGESLLLGYPESGVGVVTQRTFEGNGTDGSIRLDLQVGLGQIDVRQIYVRPR
jgi:phage shock protein PspC (stress-responsive transcriptional regulator)